MFVFSCGRFKVFSEDVHFVFERVSWFLVVVLKGSQRFFFGVCSCSFSLFCCIFLGGVLSFTFFQPLLGKTVLIDQNFYVSKLSVFAVVF